MKVLRQIAAYRETGRNTISESCNSKERPDPRPTLLVRFHAFRPSRYPRSGTVGLVRKKASRPKARGYCDRPDTRRELPGWCALGRFRFKLGRCGIHPVQGSGARSARSEAEEEREYAAGGAPRRTSPCAREGQSLLVQRNLTRRSTVKGSSRAGAETAKRARGEA